MLFYATCRPTLIYKANLDVSACVRARVCMPAAGCVSLHPIAISFETAVFKSIIRLGHLYGISDLGLLFGIKTSFDNFHKLFTQNMLSNVSRAEKG